MGDEFNASSDSDTDDLNSCIWSLKKRKSINKTNTDSFVDEITHCSIDKQSLQDKYRKFEELRKKSNDIRTVSAKRLLVSEKRRSKKLIKKALRDPLIKELVDKNQTDSANQQISQEKDEKKEWNGVKPFLNVNNHLQGAVSHGDWGPKSELESIIDNAIKEGDFEKAELLSDSLANREFATKITKAYAAKRSHEQIQKLKLEESEKKSKKIRWTFDAKERWQMKGNM